MKLKYILILFIVNILKTLNGQSISLYSNDSLKFQAFDNSTLILDHSQSKLIDGCYNVYSEFDSSMLIYCFTVKDKNIEGTIFKYIPPTGKLREIVIYENKRIIFYLKLNECENEYFINPKD